MHICLIGNTGSGKTTLAEALHDAIDLPLVSSGRIARSLSEGDAATDLALKQGAMAPEQAMRFAVRTEIEAAEIQRGGWIMDGFPRTVEQLVCLMQWTNAMPVFVYLALEPWHCIERLTQRARVDDNPDSIARKFVHFEDKTLPMIQMLRGGGVLHEFQADTDLSELVQAVQARIS